MCAFVESSQAFVAKAVIACVHRCPYIVRRRALLCVLLTHVWKPGFTCCSYVIQGPTYQAIMIIATDYTLQHDSSMPNQTNDSVYIHCKLLHTVLYKLLLEYKAFGNGTKPASFYTNLIRKVVFCCESVCSVQCWGMLCSISSSIVF